MRVSFYDIIVAGIFLWTLYCFGDAFWITYQVNSDPTGANLQTILSGALGSSAAQSLVGTSGAPGNYDVVRAGFLNGFWISRLIFWFLPTAGFGIFGLLIRPQRETRNIGYEHIDGETS